MDAGKVKVVLNALQDELRARRAASGQPIGDSAGESPAAAQLATAAAGAASAAGVPEENSGGAEPPVRPIPEFVVPFMVPEEPLIALASSLLRAAVAAAAVAIVLVLLL